MSRHISALMLVAALALPSLASAQHKVEGVNPADMLTQVQVTTEYNRLDGDTDQWSLTGKYDYRFAGTPIGLNFELPAVISLDGPGFNSTGHGDLFARARYVKSFGQWSFGGAFEVVAPIGKNTFSGGRWQTNPAVLAVYAWDQQNITAMVHKRTLGYITDDSSKSDINQYTWRALQVHIFPTGWFAQGDVSYVSDILANASWYDTRFSLGKQISARARLQGELKKLSGDRSNDWAVSLSYAVKL